MSEQQGQAPAAADTTPTTDPAPAPVEQVQVISSEDAATQQAPAATVAPEPQNPETPAPTPAPPAPATEAKSEVEAEEKPATGDDLAALSQADLAKMVRDLRKENASDRTAAKTKAAQEAQDELVQRLGRELGLIKDEEKPPSAEELASQLTAAQKTAADRDAELRTLRVETAAAKAARTHGADVDALLDSRSFADKLGALNPSTDDFPVALDALVKRTVEDNPKYKLAGPAPTASSGDFSGGSGDKPPTRTDIEDFRKARRGRSGIDR